MSDLPPQQTRPSKKTFFQGIKTIVETHTELVEHEWAYEKKLATRRLLGLGLTLFCLCLALFSVQLALIGILLRLGTRLEWIGVVGLLLNILLAIFFYRFFSTRDPAIPIAFEKTREQLKRTLEWIETLI